MREPIFYRIMRPFLYLYFKITVNPTIINKEEIPKKGRVILAGNHTNNLDSLILGYSTHRSVRFLAKIELAKGPLGILFKWMGIIPVNRKIHDKSVIPTAVKYLNKEALIGIYPEGTINRTKDIIMPFKKGTIKMSLESHSPIIPFAITGNYKDKTACIRFGKLYYPKTDDIEKETHILEEKVITLLKEVD